MRHATPRLLAALLLALLLNACATYAPRPAAPASGGHMPDATAVSVVTEWQRRLEEHVAQAGSGDPSVLSQMPGRRSSAVLRPGQIVFAATDVESFVAERDGYDVFGLLLGKHVGANGPLYVFVVGAVERRNYRSVAVADLRVTAMSVRNGVVTWQTGSSDDASLALYRNSADPSAAVRFPADKDQFRMAACPQGVCVEERISGARWTLYLGEPVAAAPSSR
jgi:hypothetical protein